jgi:hypothetical protein
MIKQQLAEVVTLMVVGRGSLGHGDSKSVSRTLLLLTPTRNLLLFIHLPGTWLLVTHLPTTLLLLTHLSDTWLLLTSTSSQLLFTHLPGTLHLQGTCYIGHTSTRYSANGLHIYQVPCFGHTSTRYPAIG